MQNLATISHNIILNGGVNSSSFWEGIYQITSILPEAVSRLPLCFLRVRLDRELKDPLKLDKSAAKAVIVALTSAETFGLFCNSATRASAFAF